MQALPAKTVKERTKVTAKADIAKAKEKENPRTKAVARLATPDNAQTAQTRKMFAEITFTGNARLANLAPEITHLLAVSSEPREVVAKVKIACFRTSTPTGRLLQGLAQPLRQLTTRRVTTTQEPSEDVKAAVVEAVDDEKSSTPGSHWISHNPLTPCSTGEEGNTGATRLFGRKRSTFGR